MAKVKRRTKAGKAADAAFSAVMAVIFGLLALGLWLLTAVLNVASVSTIADFDLRQYGNNILSLHSDSSYQTSTELSVYDDRKFTLIRNKQYSFSLPQGAVFKFRGDVNRNGYDWIAIEVFDGVEKRTGYVAIEENSLGTAASGTRDVSRYENGGLPLASKFVTYPIIAQDDGIRESIWQRKLLPQLRHELRINLSITKADTALAASALKEDPDLFHVEELDEDGYSYFAGKDQKETYQTIVGHYEGGLDMALYQIDPDFDALQRISEGKIPKAYSLPLWGWAILLISGVYLIALIIQPRKVRCPSCGTRSSAHELCETSEFQAYKHQTKSGKPDARYKDNPLLTYRISTFTCVGCGEQFEHRA